ncbi:biopolymer transporter ExbD [bacterium]|nr:biopolymer transporter ExbD [candidate division CSSED10-310 bacterium]
MAKKIRKSKVQARVPTDSMSDIAFLLIIFFMVSTTFAVDKTSVELPSSVERLEIPKGPTTISLQKTGELRIEGKEATMMDIQPAASEQLLRNMEHYFLLKIDRNVRYEMVDEILDQLRMAGARNLSFPTLQELPD